MGRTRAGGGEGRRSPRVWRPTWASGEPFPLGRPWTQEAAGCALSVGLCGHSGEGSRGAKAAVGRVLALWDPVPTGSVIIPKDTLSWPWQGGGWCLRL